MSGEARLLKAGEYASQFIGDAEAIAFESYKDGYAAGSADALKDAEREGERLREAGDALAIQLDPYARDDDMLARAAIDEWRTALKEPAPGADQEGEAEICSRCGATPATGLTDGCPECYGAEGVGGIGLP